VTYRPPPRAICDIREFPVELPATIPGTHTLNVNLWFYRNQLRQFTLEQTIWIAEAWHSIVRWDTSHGVVHRHRLTWGGHTASSEEFEVLPDATGAAIRRLEHWYDKAYDELIDQMDNEVERWIRVYKSR